MNLFKVWGLIIANPFKGFEGVKKETGVLFPFLIIIMLTVINLLILTPVMQSDTYVKALARVQMIKMAEKGLDGSLSVEELEKQLSSPGVRKITLISSYGGGIVTITAVMLLSAFLIWILSIIFRDKKSYKMILKILVFSGVVAAVQGILKSIIVVSGDWQMQLMRVKSMEDFTMAIQAPISFASFFQPSVIGMPAYTVIDTVTDILNWIYYIFVYAGLRSALNIEKKKSLNIVLIYAVIGIIIGVAAASFV